MDVRNSKPRLDPPLPAEENMARDRAMIAAVAAPGGPDRLVRVFEWEGPALSLGRSNAAGGIDRAVLADAGIAIVRRPTGGGALLHGTDVSWSVAVRHARGQGAPDLVEAGRALAAPVRTALRTLGLPAEFRSCDACAGGAGPDGFPLCFLQRTPYDLVVGDRKVAAFALRRTAGVLFLHGSVLVEPPAAAVIAALVRAGAGDASGWAAARAAVAPVAALARAGRRDVREALAGS